MVILGAGGHAIELLDIINKKSDYDNNIFFFDNVSNELPGLMFGEYPIITTINQLVEILDVNKDFTIGVGNPTIRRSLMKLGDKSGGEIQSLISLTANIGNHNVILGIGLNIMHYVMVSSNCRIEEGCLINARTSIHHDCTIGAYTEVGPNCTITGNVTIGSDCIIGAGAVILPGTRVGKNCVIGAGAVVTKDVTTNTMVVGVPAKPVSKS